MPKAPSICSQVNCPEPATRAGRCDQHQRTPWASNDPRRDHLPRNWAVLRRRILDRDHWTCQLRDPGCTLQASEVDHLGDRDDHRPAMLRAACHHCHAARTAAQGVDARTQ